MKEAKNKPVKKVEKAWIAINKWGNVWKHEGNISLYKTKRGMESEIYDFAPICFEAVAVPCTISYSLPPKKKLLAHKNEK